MKITAHPLMAAVALGLLGPVALETELGEGLSERPQSTRSIDAEDFERVERLWKQARTQVEHVE